MFGSELSVLLQPGVPGGLLTLITALFCSAGSGFGRVLPAHLNETLASLSDTQLSTTGGETDEEFRRGNISVFAVALLL